MVPLIMMTAVAAMVTVIILVFQELLSTKGLSYLGRIPQFMHQEEELMLGQFILHFTYFVLLK